LLGIVIVAHGGLAQEYLSAAEHVVGINLNVKAISIFPSDNMSEKEKQIKIALSEVEDGAGVIVVTDMHGSTPANLALKASKGLNCCVVFGTNLPLLVKLIKVRNLSARDAVNLALDSGKKYINSVNRIL
tara:strand:- start:839 stop:1228 length:390 start_codon:yes stop_codon:yes gene_type:complete